MTLSAATRGEIARQRDRYPQPRSAVLPSLWAVQHEAGYLTPEGMSEVADILGLAPSEVQAVATFYSMYFDKKGGDHHALVCINVSCALRGADDIVAHMERRLGCASGGTSSDGAFTWESTVECLGACGGAPAMQIDHHFHENLTPDAVDAILDEYRGSGGAHPHGVAVAAAADGASPAQAEPGAGAGADTPAPKKKTSARSKRPRVNADDV